MIRNVTLKDAGVYICELNSTPNVTRSFHELKIISDRLLAPVVASDHEDNDNKDNDKEVTSRDSIDVWNYSTERPINHDYSDCCISKNVTKKCLGFCNIKNILDGNTGKNIFNLFFVHFSKNFKGIKDFLVNFVNCYCHDKLMKLTVENLFGLQTLLSSFLK